MSTGVTTFFSPYLQSSACNGATGSRPGEVVLFSAFPIFQRLDIHTGVAKLVLMLMHHCGLVLSNLAAFSV